MIAGFTTTIAWGVIEYDDAIRWSMDYLMKVHKLDFSLKVHWTAKPNGFYERVGDTAANERWYRPEDWPIYEHEALHYSCYKRHALFSPSHFLAEEAIGELIACFAATSIVFRSYDHEYSLQLLKHAEELYKVVAANPYRTLNPKRFGLEKPSDEAAWACIWLFRATNQTKYLVEAENLLKENEVQAIESLYRTGSRWFGVLLLAAKLTKQKRYINPVNEVYYYYLTMRKILFDLMFTSQNAADLAFVFLQAMNTTLIIEL